MTTGRPPRRCWPTTGTASSPSTTAGARPRRSSPAPGTSPPPRAPRPPSWPRGLRPPPPPTPASPLLANHGYCVFTFNYGGSSASSIVQGTGDIAASAGQLASFVTRVLAATGAAKADLVGHSQGGMMPRYYLKFLGGARNFR